MRSAPTALLPLAAALLTLPARAQAPGDDRDDAAGLSFAAQTYRLENGLVVTLHQDRSLPQVVVDTWYWVGSKDEAPGRTGFAHLFEHLMFMGTARVPYPQFDVLMESGGGWNNASTSEDRTDYFSVGPSAMLGTLLWLDADRLEALGANMTQAKLDSQREVVRNERRQTSENTPYGKAELLVSELMYPEGHPYHHPIIGSHADLAAATLADVVAFFDTHYTTTNASLVVAGDFEIDAAKELVARTFGQVARRPPPRHVAAPPASLPREVRRIERDAVQFPKLSLVWHSPAYMTPGDGEMDLVAALLTEGPSSRLVQRLVHRTKLAQSVEAFQASGDLGSLFQIDAIAAPGADLEELRGEIQGAIDALLADGPDAAELERVKASIEAGFLQRMESLFARADRMNAYVAHWGVADGFQRDLERWTAPTAGDVVAWGRRVLGPERLDLRVLPDGMEVPATWPPDPTGPAEPAQAASLLDAPPEVPERTPYAAPAPVELALANGARLLCYPRPGSGLFAGAVYGAGGPGVLPADEAGLAELVGEMLGSGAGGLDAAEFGAAVDALGAGIAARPGRYGFSISVRGLSSRLEATLDRFADVVLRPNLAADDFAREQALLAAAVAARADDPRQIVGVVARALAFGRTHPSGVALDGYADTVAALEHADLAPAFARLLHAGNATFAFAGDFEPGELKDALDARFGAWQAAVDGPAIPAPVTQAAPGRLVVVDRPGSPQTTIVVLRALPAPADEAERMIARCVGTVLGGSFTSRLNQNLREEHGYTYGASFRFGEEGDQHLLQASTAVHTPVTGAALTEIRRELEQLATGDVTADELGKALETVRADLVTSLETTRGAAGVLESAIADRRPADVLARDLRALDAVTLDAANTLARRGFLDWSTLQVVLVGDRAAIEPQLAEAGFGEPVAADADGTLLDG
jgi:predicted Zn-dependent peptidase